MSNTDKKSEQCEELINNCEPIDALNPDSRFHDRYKRIFEDLQGGIIKSYGRKYSLYLFIQFDPNKVDEVKQWIRDEVASSVTSTWKQLEDTRTYKERRGLDSSYIGELCKDFLLSIHGYKTLGFNEEELKNKMDFNFYGGMLKEWEDTYRLEQHPEAYWYNPPECWDVGGNHEKIDALILLTHDGLEEMEKEASTTIGKCEKIGKVLACEAGYVLRENPNDKTESFVGPFGFLDGISQPLFLKSDYDKYRETENIDKWDPKASLNLVLEKDPFGEVHSFGSYCVWQKLETNYQSFEDKVGELAKELGCDRERASALAIGRFKDGTPLDLSDRPNQNGGSLDRNNFDYADDRDGGRCPVQAHIRKVNPRQDDKLQAEFRRTNDRIVRAGTTYFDDPAAQQTPHLSTLQLCLNKLVYLDEVSKRSLIHNVKDISGLLFVCFQRSIKLQFLKLQEDWADNRKFPRRAESKYLDPIVGHPTTKEEEKNPPPQEWPKKWDGKETKEFSFFGCVKNRGGEFLFAPSISFLNNL